MFWSSEQVDARRDAENAVRLFAEQVDRTIVSADMALRVAVLELARDPNTDVLARLLKTERLELGPISQLSFVSRDGLLIATQDGPDESGNNLSDRDYFIAHRDRTVSGLLVSPPLFGRRIQKWVIPITRRVSDASGDMVGLVNGSVDPGYFSGFWSRLDPAGELSLRLLDRQGRVYASTGDPYALIATGEKRLDDLEFIRDKTETAASLRSARIGDAFTAYRRIASADLTVVADRVMPRFWSDVARSTVFLGLAASVFTGLLAAWVWRVTRKLKVTEKRAVQSETRLRSAIDSLSDGFGIIDHDHRIVMMNAALRTFYPGPPQDLQVGADYKLVRAKGYASGRMRDENGGLLVFDEVELHKRLVNPPEVRIQRLDDRWIRILERRTPTGDIVSIRTDITEMKLREEELQKSRAALQAQAGELKALAEKAEAATLAKSAFVAAMSHEIRTPLNAIIGFGDLLARASLPPEQKHFASIIRESSHHLLRIADDILDFEKLVANKVTLKPEAFDLIAGIYGLADVASGLVGDRPIAIGARLSTDLPERVFGDWLRLKQILINLIGNAVKFTQSGEVEIAVSKTPSGRIRFAIRDTGPGIAKTDHAAIFEVFEQGRASGARKSGSGLGLTIVRRLVELMGGQISLESELGKGSTFSFDIDLPLAKPIVSRLSEPMPTFGAAQVRKRILLADDVASARLLLSTMLRMRGHDVVAVEDGLEALAAAGAERFDCILLDFQMPNMGGLEAARLIRQLPGANGTAPIYGFSAQVLEQDRLAAAAAGMNGFLPKPLREDALDRVLNELPAVAA